MMPPPPPPARVIHNTVHQTVVHLHQTNHQHIQSRTLLVTALSRSFPVAVVRPMEPGPEGDDPTRPARAARRLVRLLSTESARRVLRPFFRDVLHTLVREERERWHNRPRQTLLALWGLVGWHKEIRGVELRYAVHQRAGAQGLCRLPDPPPPPPAREGMGRTAEADTPHGPSEPPRPSLSRGEFQALVQGVSAELSRRSRLDTLRKGGW